MRKSLLFLQMRSWILGSSFVVPVATLQAQLVVTPQTDLAALAEAITGPGVSISNPVINCHAQGFGEFSFSGTSLGLDEGVILTSGRITDAIGPNTVDNVSFSQGTAGDAILNVVTGRSTRDACKFEFDIIPGGDSLRFNFVLGSEEYNEWVGSQYNDVFGFFISGPGITGDAGIGNDKNIALVPGTSQPVTINNVNNGSNSAYYFDNAGGQNIQYDGFTQGLYAEAVVQPCQTYHLKLIIADATDRAFDSGVFIERIRSNQVTMTSHTLNGSADMVEGCNPGWVTFTRPSPLPTPLNLQYFLRGNATNGIDYSAIGNINPNVPKNIMIPANQTSVTVNVNPLADGANEGSEDLLFILGNPFCPAQNVDSLLFSINDTLIANVTPTIAQICRGDSVQFTVTGGASYAWSPSTGLSSTTSATVWAKPLSQTVYTVTVTDGTCSRTMNRLVRVSNPQLTATVTRPLCNGQTNGAINLTVSGGIAPLSYSWSGPGGFTANSEDLVNIGAGTYTLTFHDAINCTRTQSFNVGSPDVLGATLSPSILPFGENITCFGASTGTLGLSITGGTAPYTRNWTGPNGFTSTAQNLSGLAAGTYNVNIVDVNGCTFSTGYTMTQPTPLAPTIGGVTNLACFGVNIGTATASVTGGTPPFNYSWNTAPVQISATASGLGTGSYTVTVTDGYGCTATANTAITGPASAVSTTVGSTTNVTCFGAANGNATVNASGGTGPYSFSWNTTPAQSSNTATDLPPGTWTCTVTDNNGCSTTRNITITQPAAALASNVSGQTHVNCFGGNTGSATVSAFGGTAPYTYSWNTTPAQNSATANNLLAGTWTCTITDARGCTTQQQATITQPTNGLGSSITAQTNVGCFGGATGSATVQGSGGTAPYSYSWNTTPVQNNATATNLTAGIRTCTITDANGCTTTRTVTITQPAAALSSSASAQTNVSCFGGTNGSATVTPSGGSAPYGYSWNTTPVQTSATASGLPAGTWTCTITDANGCTTARNITVTQPAAALSSTAGAQTNVACFGANTGTTTVSATGGTAPYTYSWNTTPTQTASTANSLTAGSWTCTITDARGCTTTRSITILEPAVALGSSVTAQTNVGCSGANNGAATVAANGGTAPYNYTWNTTPVQTGPTAPNLPAGTFTCTITDANGCTTTRNVIITQPASGLSSSIGTQINVACFGSNTGSATVNAAGGTAPYSYSWNTVPVQTAAIANNLSAGNWTCTITDANGCSATRTVTITQPAAALSTTVSAQTNVACFGGNTGSATVSATGGTGPYTFSWNTTPVQTNATATNLTVGLWSCTVTDANGCTTVRNVTITQPTGALASTISSITQVNCFGGNTGTATVSGTGGTAPYTYSWNTTPAQNNGAATALTAGTWTCTITDANGCTATRTITITQPASALSTSISAQTNVGCFGASTGSATILVSGGTAAYTYSWNTTPAQNSATANNLTAGTWTCTVMDANGCTAQRNVTITQPAVALGSSIQVQTNVGCSGNNSGAATVAAIGGTGPYTFNWNTVPAQTTATASNLTSGTWTCTITDANGCTTARNVTITQPAAALASTLSAQTNVACFGANTGIATVSVSGGTTPYSYSWNTTPVQTNATANNLPAGTWTCTVSDANGCTTTRSVTITQPASALSTSLTAQTNVSCFGANTGTATVEATGGTAPYSFVWNTTPAQTTAVATNLTAGTWSCIVTDANGCTALRTITITQPAAALALSGAVTAATCGGAANGAVDATVTGGTAPYIIGWTGPNGFTATTADIGAIPSGVYVLNVTDGNGCTATNSFNVGQPGLFTITATTSDYNGAEVSCPSSSDGSIDQTVTGGTGAYTHAWTGPNGFTATTMDITALVPGTYTYIVTDINDCSTSATYVLDAPAPLSATLSAPSVIGGWNIACNGAATGQLSATITGGVAPVGVQWVGPGGFNASATNITGLTAGSYTLTLTDANGCTFVTGYTLTQPPVLGGTGTMVSAVNCFGGSNGIAQTTPTGGTAPYSYLWNTVPAQTTSNAVDLPAGLWSCTVTDANGCSVVVNTTITGPAQPLSVSVTGSTPVLCHGHAEGTANASANGGTIPYTYSWNSAPAQTSANAIDLLAGTYTVTVTDVNGCTATDVVTIAQPATPVNAFFDIVTPESCFGANDGAATITLSGGSNSFTVTWDTQPVITGPTATGLAPGLYTVSVTDNNGCSEVKNYPVTIQGSAAPLAFTVDVVQISCANGFDGAIDLTVTGGQAPYSHIWTDEAANTNGLEDINQLGPGAYTLQLVDAFGCTRNTAVTIVEPTALSLSGAITTAACQGTATGAVNATIGGGTTPYTFSWSGPSGFTASTEDIADLEAGTYVLFVMDANGCTITESFNVSQPGSLELSATTSSFIGGWGVACNAATNGSIDLTATGGTGPFDFSWYGPNGFVATTEDISGLSSGTYTVSVDDQNGCAVQLAVTVTTPEVLTVALAPSAFNGNNISCNGANDGALAASISGGTAPYSTTWSGPNGYSSSNEDINGLAPGSYTLNVVDANGCTTAANITLTTPPTLVASTTVTLAPNGDAIACNGAATGSIQLATSGGTASYSVVWTGPNGYTANAPTITDLVAGTYSATVTDANSCSTTATAILEEPAAIDVIGVVGNYNGLNVSCASASDGSIDITVSGGAGNNSFGWSGPDGFGASAEDVSGLAAGTYTVLVTDINGCTASADFDLQAPEELTTTTTSSNFNGSNTSCSGASDGSIDLTVSGGVAPHSYAWTGPNGFTSNVEDPAALAAGEYAVVITDANGCSASTSVTLTGPTTIGLALQTSAFGADQISCAGAGDGSIDLTITGGTAPYLIAWTEGLGFTADTEDITGLDAGIYQALVTDANGCSQTISATLTAPDPIDVNASLSQINGNNVTCDGATDGSIDLTVTGGIAPYLFAWDNGSTDEDLANITAGTYIVVITDANGCTADASYTLTAPVTVSVDVSSTIQPGGNNITCSGGTDGDLAASVSGGTAPYSIAWTGPDGFTSNAGAINSLAAGTYQLMVTDANGCSHISDHVLTQPQPVMPLLSAVAYNGGANIPCAGDSLGMLSVSTTGGTPTYGYAWSGPNGFTSNDQNLSGLIAGTYTLTVMDSNGCAGSASTTLTAPTPLAVNLNLSDFNGAQVSCQGNDGSIDLTITGGTPSYQLDWTGPNGFGTQDEDIASLVAGVYSLVLTDANGCSVDTTIVLHAPEPLAASFNNTANICGDASIGTIDVTVTGGGAPYNYQWSGPAGQTSNDEDLTDLFNGAYTLTVSDALGCNSTFSTSLNGPAPLISGSYVSFYGQYNLQCQGDSTGVLSITPQGGTAPVDISISGPNGFSSNTGNNTGLIAGDYQVNLTDANGCVLDTTITLTEPLDGVNATLDLGGYPSGTNVSCFGANDGSIDATITGGTGPYVFTWRGPDSLAFTTEDVTGLPAGDYAYELVVTDANQCSFFTTVTLTQPDSALTATSVTSTFLGGYNVSCNGNNDGAIDLTAAGGNGGFEYAWSGPNGFTSTDEDINALGGGQYIASVTDMNGCLVEHVVDLLVPDVIAPGVTAATFPGGTSLSCAGMNDGAISMDLSGGAAPHAIVWNGPDGFSSTDTLLTGLAEGTYCVNITDANGCSADTCLTLSAPAPLNATATASGGACDAANGAVDLSINGGSSPYNVLWNNGATSEDLSGLNAGTYSATITDVNGCNAMAEAVVIGSPAVTATANTTANACFGDTNGGIDLALTTGTAPFTFVWSNGATSEDLSNLTGGSYTVLITDAAGCALSETYTIQQPTAIGIDTVVSVYGDFNVSAFGANDGSIIAAVSGGTAPYVFGWSNGAITESIDQLPAGTYTLLVTDANGCTAEFMVTLTESTDLEMPTGFSPNNDGSNDAFVIRGIDGYPRNQFTVLNRWGNVVYDRLNYSNDWAGENSQGDQLPDGTYFVILSINDGTRTLQGYVDLRR